jgi:Flp pilus assembly protein TadG
MQTLPAAPVGSKQQQGAAAVEFAISILLILLIFFGIVTYGSLFWMQQKISHISADGARYALAESLRSSGTLLQTAGKACQYITAASEDDSLLETFNPTCTPAQASDACAQCIRLTVTITDPASIWPFLNLVKNIASLIPGSASEALVPSTLTSSATIQIFTTEP